MGFRAVSFAAGIAICALVVIFAASSASAAAAPSVYRVERVADGDTITLRNGQRVRLVQIDTPEVYFVQECFGPEASARTKKLLPPGTRVNLFPEPAGDRVDDFGRLLRYVVRVSDKVNINLRLVAVGAAVPWFYDGEIGRYAARMDKLAKNAMSKKLGLWRACPGTKYDPYEAIETRR
jgi:endonuclease YncB( thermonuclease family)